MKIKIVLCLMGIVFKSLAQSVYHGTLIDSASRQPIEFANIGIVGKALGTVSDERGAFSLTIPDSLKNESVRISMIGYRSVNARAENLGKTVVLVQVDKRLDEVIVKPRNMRTTILGNETMTNKVGAGFRRNSLGCELAVRLNIKHRQTQVKKFFVNIQRNSIGPLIFRFNLYSADAHGDPGENILKENIIVQTDEAIGLVTLDLDKYQIYVDKDVFIALEWIKDLGDATSLYFSTKLIGTSTYHRQASQDKWNKISPIGVGLHAEVAYEK